MRYIPRLLRRLAGSVQACSLRFRIRVSPRLVAIILRCLVGGFIHHIPADADDFAFDHPEPCKIKRADFYLRLLAHMHEPYILVLHAGLDHELLVIRHNGEQRLPRAHHPAQRMHRQLCSVLEMGAVSKPKDG